MPTKPGAGTVPTMWTAPLSACLTQRNCERYSASQVRSATRLWLSGGPYAGSSFSRGNGLYREGVDRPTAYTRYGSSGPAPPGACRRRYFDWRPRGQFIFSFGVIDAQAFARTVSSTSKAEIIDFEPHRHYNKPGKRGKKGQPTSRWLKRLGKHDQLVEYFKPRKIRPEWMLEEEYNSFPASLVVPRVALLDSTWSFSHQGSNSGHDAIEAPNSIPQLNWLNFMERDGWWKLISVT